MSGGTSLAVQWLGLHLPVRGGVELWKVLKEMGLPDHLTCLLRNLYAGQEANS